MLQNSHTKKSYERFPIYLDFLTKIENEYVSSKLIAQETNFKEISVRKDLSSITNIGKPKLGFNRLHLIAEIKKNMRYLEMDNVILVGYGKLGQALCHFEGFKEYGVNIIQGFDVVEVDNVLHISKLKEYCNENNIKFAAITVPKAEAQAVADLLVDAGIKGIWNFSTQRLVVPDDVVIQNENLATSLSILVKATIEVK